MFQDKKFYFHPAKLSITRLKLFESQVINNGGIVVRSSELATHVVIEESCDKSGLPSSLWTGKTCVVGSLWVSQCLKTRSVVDHLPYTVEKPCQKRSSSSQEPASVEGLETEHLMSGTGREIKKFACSQSSSTVTGSDSTCNSLVLSQFQKLSDAYRVRGDQWRTHGYEKAISAIRRYGKEIKTFKEVVALDGVGAKMAAKVMEIISTGSLRKVAELCEMEESKVTSVFSNVWGAGPSAASAWYLKGHRTLGDLIEKENLTKQQKIGIKYYDEFLERISRDEVEEIGEKVNHAAKEVDCCLKTMLCGSYRRGKSTCGDVDVVVIRPDRLGAKDVLTSILTKLKESGFITDDLVSLEKSGNQRKYLGVCKLPGNERLHRRLDIFIVPQSEFACAIMHYTGSALFNRSVRLLAAKKNMHLSEHSLSAGVVRQGSEILNQGHLLETPSEESIFKHLDLEYRPPEERDH